MRRKLLPVLMVFGVFLGSAGGQAHCPDQKPYRLSKTQPKS